jgi:hypothetical protein
VQAEAERGEQGVQQLAAVGVVVHHWERTINGIVYRNPPKEPKREYGLLVPPNEAFG